MKPNWVNEVLAGDSVMKGGSAVEFFPKCRNCGFFEGIHFSSSGITGDSQVITGLSPQHVEYLNRNSSKTGVSPS